jgi:hypothetical protein
MCLEGQVARRQLAVSRLRSPAEIHEDHLLAAVAWYASAVSAQLFAIVAP